MDFALSDDLTMRTRDKLVAIREAPNRADVGKVIDP